MTQKFTIEQIKTLLDETLASFPHEECYTCECFLGYLTRLELDADQEARSLFSQYKPERKHVHSCIGCDPCPPADAFAKYMLAERLINPIEILDQDSSCC